MSKKVFVIILVVLGNIFLLLEGCSSRISFQRGYEQKETEEAYPGFKEMRVKVQELQKIPVSRFWKKTSVSQPKEQVAMIRNFYSFRSLDVMDFFGVPLQEDAFVLFQNPILIDVPSFVASRNKIDIFIFNPDGPGIYRKLEARVSLRSPHLPQKFVVSGFKYLGNGEFIVEHKYRPGFSFKKCFLLVFKIIVILIAGCVIGLMFFNIDEEAKTKHTSSPT